MPKRTDISSILLIGSGPIIIGQGAEFDYSGTQAARALQEEGYRVILVNSNPATIMTDPEVADRTYIEPITPEWVEKIIVRERPDALLPTMGGQTALNVAMALARDGVLERHRVELIGANERAIRIAEDRQEFAQAMRRIGLATPLGFTVKSVAEGLRTVEETGYPAILRPSYTLGGTGGGVAYDRGEFEAKLQRGLELSPVGSVLVERSILGWKEFELEVMRDGADNVVIVCSIENLDPMGVHTGDSITVAPIMTLTDREYQAMRDAACKIIREVGVEAGGCNVQFAVNPADGELLVIEMNPRVSRSSALASKATGFPIARIGAKLAVGYRLDELPNDITRTTPASFEPVLDYVVVKIPRFAFEKFPSADPTLTTQMKSVGEVMAIGRTFKAALQKGFRGLETGRPGWAIGETLADDRLSDDAPEALLQAMRTPTPERLFQVKRALLAGVSVAAIAEASRIDPWFLAQLEELVEAERNWREGSADDSGDQLRHMKRLGFSDRQLGDLLGVSEAEIRTRRQELGIRPAYKMVDTCAGEFPSKTPYLYSSYDDENEISTQEKPTVVVLGSGPNRIGQGVEFDYCCVRAALAFRQMGYRTVMVNSNPETVSTDFDISDALYFEPLTLEDVLEIVQLERPLGVVVQLGGQTPLRLARGLEAAGAPILGTSPEAIDAAEDRGRFEAIARELGIAQPPNGTARSLAEAVREADRIGYPVLIRPSYVLGGRAMHIVYDRESLTGLFAEAERVAPGHPVLIDRFLEDAFEADVDAISDGHRSVIGGVMQHIEDAGVHSGDSACVLPPFLLTEAQADEMRRCTRALADRLGVVGLINVQFAIKDGVVYVLEVNPRASRTVPFVSKTTGVSLAAMAAGVMTGRRLEELGLVEQHAGQRLPRMLRGDLVVQRGAPRTELAHRAQHQGSRTTRLERIHQPDRLAHRCGIGIVRVVDDREVAVLGPATAHLQRFQRAHATDRQLVRHAAGARYREGEHRVPQVVDSGNPQLEPRAAEAGPAAAVAAHSPLCRPYVAGIKARLHDPPCPGPRGGADVGLRCRRDPELDTGVNRCLLAHHSLERAQSLEVLLTHRRDDSDVGGNQAAQEGDFSRLTGPDLHHGHGR